MPTVLKILKYSLLVLVSFYCHVVIINILPFPLSTLNVPFIVFIWYAVYSNDSSVFIAAFPVFFLLELFTATPFGALIIGGISALIVVTLLLHTTFTNRSAYIVTLLGVIGISVFRAVSMLYIFSYQLITGQVLVERLLGAWTRLLTEVALSALVLGTLYYFSTFFFRRLNPKYIDLYKTPYDSKPF